ncbi:hypothetical protein [Streptomyces cucumeris]|uniref:hypothetical protein n=1 Tax=Streptomyces cucumeris TaxID=2962890 RepID=UPI0020C84483|nr:hypothetical protein [Streptomyces sp. NEAU-Y11]MCP9209584.1 hypothetical protein [Streptomyces sp. NEAU-Y11]
MFEDHAFGRFDPGNQAAHFGFGEFGLHRYGIPAFDEVPVNHLSVDNLLHEDAETSFMRAKELLFYPSSPFLSRPPSVIFVNMTE